jgi:hypothetical protein
MDLIGTVAQEQQPAGVTTPLLCVMGQLDQIVLWPGFVGNDPENSAH